MIDIKHVSKVSADQYEGGISLYDKSMLALLKEQVSIGKYEVLKAYHPKSYDIVESIAQREIQKAKEINDKTI